MVMWSTEEGRCPCCGDSGITVYNFGEGQICGKCALIFGREYLDMLKKDRLHIFDTYPHNEFNKTLIGFYEQILNEIQRRASYDPLQWN